MLRKLTVLIFIGLGFGQAFGSQIKVAKIFSNHMVLQRGIAVPVWGWAEPDEQVSVTFDGKRYEATARDDGKWIAYLPEMKAGGPHRMQIAGRSGEIVIDDILIGDVWLCSGQSNMEWTVAQSRDAQDEIASASDNRIRHFKVPRSFSDIPESDLAGGEWVRTSPETVGDFTAVGYYFARELRKHQDVPIGLLNSSWGGSRIEPWMTANSLGFSDSREAAKEIRQKQQAERERLAAALKEKMGSLPGEDAGLQNGVALWARPDHDDRGWPTMKIPGLWEQSGFNGLDGIVWFRKEFTLTKSQADQGITLSLGKIDDSDITWVNGEKVGETKQAWNQNRLYKIPAEVLRAGSNGITIRVEDTGGGGGIHGSAGDIFFSAGTERVSLSGDWKYRVAKVELDSVSQKNQVPTLLFNKMVNPIIDFPIKGALWYQGESNAGEADALRYRGLFAAMIKDWRKQWKVGEFPFLWVQLANFMAADDQPSESSWAVLRESQSATLAVPNTAQAVIIDIGDAEDVHPTNKQDVGYRLSLAARKLAYGEDLIYSGPVFESMRLAGNSIRIKFKLFGSRLVVKDKYGYPKGFAIAGVDGRFVWAKARIEGDEVVVWSDQVKKPSAVRYAWGNNPDDANLYNAEGLPASPFRTDVAQDVNR